MRVDEIINHILNLPGFYKLKNVNYTTKVLKSYLGGRKSAFVRYAYIRANCLYIAVYTNHGLQELKHDSTAFGIKDFLNSNAKKLDLPIKSIEIVKIFIDSSQPFLSQNISVPTMPAMPELAKGEFEIKCKDEDLKEIFEQIREIVKINYEKQNE